MHRILIASATALVLSVAALGPSIQAQGGNKSTLVPSYPLPETLDYCADFDWDGRGDIVWQHPTSRALLVQSIYGGALLEAREMAVTLEENERLMAINCMDHDDLEPDLIVQNSKTRDVHIIRMQDDRPLQRIWVTTSMSDVIAARDFNRDGHIDLVLQLAGTGTSWIQFMRGPVPVPIEPNELTSLEPLPIVASRDFDGDFRPDFVWQDPSTGVVLVTLMADATNAKFPQEGARPISGATPLRVVGTGDANQDGRSDIYLQNQTTGELTVWYMDGLTVGTPRRLSDPMRWIAFTGSTEMLNGAAPDRWPSFTPPPSPTQFPIVTVSDRPMMIVAKHSNKCLEVVNGDGRDGARLQQWQCTGSPQQMFRFLGDGRIMTFAGRSVDIASGSVAEGAAVQQWGDTGGTHQRWSLISPAKDQYLIRNKRSLKFFEVAGGFSATYDGAAIEQRDHTGESNQVWTLAPAAITLPGPLRGSGLFRLVARHSGKCLDLPSASAYPGVRLQQWTCNASPQQTFWISAAGNGVYRILTSQGQALTVNGWSPLMNGNWVQQWPWYEVDSRKWLLLPVGNGEYVITNKWGGKVLDVEGGTSATADGVGLQAWTFLGGANQIWRIQPVGP